MNNWLVGWLINWLLGQYVSYLIRLIKFNDRRIDRPISIYSFISFEFYFLTHLIILFIFFDLINSLFRSSINWLDLLKNCGEKLPCSLYTTSYMRHSSTQPLTCDIPVDNQLHATFQYAISYMRPSSTQSVTCDLPDFQYIKYLNKIFRLQMEMRHRGPIYISLTALAVLHPFSDVGYFSSTHIRSTIRPLTFIRMHACIQSLWLRVWAIMTL